MGTAVSAASHSPHTHTVTLKALALAQRYMYISRLSRGAVIVICVRQGWEALDVSARQRTIKSFKHLEHLECGL